MDVRDNIEQGKYINRLEYKADKSAYRTEEVRLEKLFRNDLVVDLAERGVPGPCCVGTVDYAWREGHSGGYTDVYSHAVEIAAVIFGNGSSR